MRRCLQCACSVLLVFSVLCMVGCKKKEDEAFTVKEFRRDGIIFSIPEKWGEVADPTASGIWVFAGEDAYAEGGFNNVSVCCYPITSKAANLSDVKKAFKDSFESKVKEQFPDAAEFDYDNYETERWKVFKASYHCTALGKNLSMTVYYPLLDEMQIYFVACDIGGEGVTADEAAQRMVETLRLEKQGEESEE